VVGREGMPEPAPRPKGPKLKFTREDDALLIQLKETKNNLTWKQIAEFFPGRSSGTLQVRYCTKLKAKTTAWSDDMVGSWLSFVQILASVYLAEHFCGSKNHEHRAVATANLKSLKTDSVTHIIVIVVLFY